jgi:two-component system NtrC family response regulator/two-component system nitrogen regulation response regulator GlnG
MVVDDQPGTCVTFKNILSRRGCQVCIAHDGEEAVKLAGQDRFDIVFLDMKLPTIDGLETYRAIRALLPDTVVVVMTGYREEMSERIAEALDASAYSCIYKPLDMEAVLALVERLGSKRRAAREPA